MKIFADDIKLYNTTDDTSILQDDLQKLYEWSNKWLLSFNIDKCCALHFGKHNINYNYCMKNHNLNLTYRYMFQDDYLVSRLI